MAEAVVARGGAVLAQRAKNFFASFVFATCGFLVYRFSPHSAGLRQVWNGDFQVTGYDVLVAGYGAYLMLLILFYMLENEPRDAKAVLALRGLRRLLRDPKCVLRSGLPHEERLGGLTMLLKVFFAPLMVLSLFDFTNNMIRNGTYLAMHAGMIRTDFVEVFNTHGFWFLFQVILFLDVFFFTIGYLIEHPALKNEIRSVDPTLLGWAVTVVCYPPFNGITAYLLGGNVVEFPHFEEPVVHVAVNLMLLVLMAIYASASVALNLKGSNLTHRGIIAHGPYRFVRHPAYACKNVAWWLGTIPAILLAAQRSYWEVFLVVGSAVAWSFLYVMRALTEEDHLRSVDGEYDAYCRKVPYRFIPGVH